MRRSRGRNHSTARRVATGAMTVLAASGIGLVAAPMAFGQIVLPLGGPILGQNITIGNAGSASANSGGNTAVGNASSNTATAAAPAGSGGTVSVPVSLGAPTNTSDGTASVTTGPANAAGNTSDTSARQSNASGNLVNSFLGLQGQSAGVNNAGSASANSGANNAVGNGSNNSATVTPSVSGGLVGVGVNLGGPTNNSTGTATINSGAANAAGNNAATDIGQAAVGGDGGRGPGRPGGPGVPGGVVPGGIDGACGAGRFNSFQNVDVSNRGQAQANTGGNVAVGNASTNNAAVTVPQTVSGGLAGVGLTIGGPVNNSSGTATINTGPATAVGNDAVTGVTQVQGCPQVVTVAGARPQPVIVQGRLQPGQAVQATLARTGLDTGDLGMIAGALLALGMLLIASQRRRLAARHAAVPMAGLGFGLGADDWDGAVR